MTPDTLLPSLASFGLLAYWLIAAAAALETWFVTGIILPGMLVVVAGGVLAQRGVLGIADLVWFAAAGAFAGSEASYWTGRLLRSRRPLTGWAAYGRAEALIRRRGGLALVLDRILPGGGLVPVASALGAMARRRFLIWSLAASVVWALVPVGAGYILGAGLELTGPLVTRVALILGAAGMALGLTGWVVWRLVRLAPRVGVVLAALARRLAATRLMRGMALRHPGLMAFGAARLARGGFAGLPLTALLAIFAYVLTLWLDGIFDFLHAGPVRVLDQRLAELIHVFWTPLGLRIAAHVTALGDGRVVVALGLAALIGLGLWGRRDLAAGLVLSVAGGQATVTLLKVLIDRPRPALARFVETSGSFPSGHAAVSVAFWGMLAYALWRAGRLGAVPAALIGVGMALAIGASRLYLIEHFLSDVVNGWLIGALWLVAGVTLAEWLGRAARPLPRQSRVATAVIVALVFAAGWTMARYDKALALIPDAQTTVIFNPQALFATHPRATESLLGTALEPINLILIVPKDQTLTGVQGATGAQGSTGVERSTGAERLTAAQFLTAAMIRAGWTEARKPSPAALGDALWALIVNRPDPNAPVTPYFWNGQPNDLAFERPVASAGSDLGPVRRHHVRLWDTKATLPDGAGLWVAAASFDDGLDRNLLHHIAPDLDAERDLLAADLAFDPAGALVRAVALPSLGGGPLRGISVAGDPWFTDGKLRVLRLMAK